MHKIKKILCIVELDSGTAIHEQPAVKRGQHLALRFKAKLYLFAGVYNEYLAGNRFSIAGNLEQERAEHISSVHETLKSTAQELQKIGLDVNYNAVWSHPYFESLMTYAEAVDADLIIKNSPYHKHMNRAYLSTYDWRLIKDCPLPLLLTRTAVWPEKQPIIAAVDPTHAHDKPFALDRKIMDMAQDFASSTSSELHVFHNYLTITSTLGPVSSIYYLPDYKPLDSEELKTQHQALLDELLKPYALPTDHTHLTSGTVKQQLQQLATDLDAGLVIMGAISRSRLGRLFIGNTAEKLLNVLPCDILIIHSEPASKNDGKQRPRLSRPKQ